MLEEWRRCAPMPSGVHVVYDEALTQVRRVRMARRLYSSTSYDAPVVR